MIYLWIYLIGAGVCLPYFLVVSLHVASKSRDQSSAGVLLLGVLVSTVLCAALWPVLIFFRIMRAIFGGVSEP